MKIIRAAVTSIEELETISIAYETDTVFQILPVSSGQEFILQEKKLNEKHYKNYDAIAGNRPSELTQRFDLKNWQLFFAMENKLKVGGALLAVNTPGVEMLEGRTDLAVLWDLRINSQNRGKGIGTALFQATVKWLKNNNYAVLKIETQNTNPEAAKFYLKQGCKLAKVIYNAYPTQANEHMLLFSYLL